jgi:hypothetical protein
VGEKFPLCKIPLFIYIEEICVSTGRLPCMIETGVFYPLLSYEKYVSM